MHDMMRAAIGLGALAATAVPATAWADVKAGVDAWGRGEYAAAITQWRGPALKGDADAQFNMGQAYKLGRGVPMDLAIALDWYAKAAKQGHLQARDNLGLVMFQQDRRAEAMPYLTESAARGEPRAQYIVGTAHFNGDLVAKDWVRAYALMSRASAAGIAQASRSLAQMDRFLSADQKRDGLSLAQELERTGKAQRNLALAGVPITTDPARAVTKPVAVPPSQPATKPVSKPRPAPPAATPVAGAVGAADIPGYVPSVPARGAPPKPAPGRSDPPVSAQATPAAVPAPVTAQAAAPAPAAGDWRVQLGAFGDEAKARALWTTLEGKVPALRSLQPYLVKAGAVTRLQGGPLASKAAADTLCKTITQSGSACFAVRR